MYIIIPFTDIFSQLFDYYYYYCYLEYLFIHTWKAGILCGFPSVDYHLLFLSRRFSWTSTATATTSNTSSTCSFPRGRVHEQASQQYDFFFNKLCVSLKRLEMCVLSKLQIFKKCRLGRNGGGQEPVSSGQFHQRTYRWHSVPVPKSAKVRLLIFQCNTSKNKQAATWL